MLKRVISMLNNFRSELAKILFITSTGLVLLVGFIFRVPLEIILIRVLIGGTIFTSIGFLLGMVLDKEQEKVEITEQKKRLKAQLQDRYKDALAEKTSSEEGFEPLDMENLTKIVVDSLENNTM